MTHYFEDVRSLSLSEGVKGVRILVVLKDGTQVEFLTYYNKIEQIKP